MNNFGSSGSTYFSSHHYIFQRRSVTSCGDVTCVNGCCKNNPCQNGGKCTEICEPTSVRYNCSCSEKFFGRHCEFERKSCQAYKAAGERSSGLYTIIDDSNQSSQVFCDFESEPGFAWNLIQSFSLSNKDCFKVSSVRFTEDVFHSPNWAYD